MVLVVVFVVLVVLWGNRACAFASYLFLSPDFLASFVRFVGVRVGLGCLPCTGRSTIAVTGWKKDWRDRNVDVTLSCLRI